MRVQDAERREQAPVDPLRAEAQHRLRSRAHQPERLEPAALERLERCAGLDGLDRRRRARERLGHAADVEAGRHRLGLAEQVRRVERLVVEGREREVVLILRLDEAEAQQPRAVAHARAVVHGERFARAQRAAGDEGERASGGVALERARRVGLVVAHVEQRHQRVPGRSLRLGRVREGVGAIRAQRAARRDRRRPAQVCRADGAVAEGRVGALQPPDHRLDQLALLEHVLRQPAALERAQSGIGVEERNCMERAGQRGAVGGPVGLGVARLDEEAQAELHWPVRRRHLRLECRERLLRHRVIRRRERARVGDSGKHLARVGRSGGAQAPTERAGLGLLDPYSVDGCAALLQPRHQRLCCLLRIGRFISGGHRDGAHRPAGSGRHRAAGMRRARCSRPRGSMRTARDRGERRQCQAAWPAHGLGAPTDVHAMTELTMEARPRSWPDFLDDFDFWV